MPSAEDTPHPPPSIFISYASEDREAARSLRDALGAAGLEVWYDESGLGGGDAWDQKIRRQIRECTYFMPVVSANTDARHEGYFRREWRLAVERTLDMADDVTFVVPVVIDETPQGRARVPERFNAVQWLKVPGGRPTPALQGWCARLLRGESPVERPPAPRRPPVRPAPAFAQPPVQHPAPANAAFPPFPEGDPHRRTKFFFDVIGWILACARLLYRELPRGIRRLIVVAVVLLILGKACSADGGKHEPKAAEAAAKVRQAVSEIQQIEQAPKGRAPGEKVDMAKLGEAVGAALAKEFGDDEGSEPPLFAVPFAAPAGDADGARFAGEVFVHLYGKLAMADSKAIGLGKSAAGAAAPLEQARSRHSRLVLLGAVKAAGDERVLDVSVVQVSDGGNVWSHAYPIKDAVAAAVADDIAAHVPSPGSGPR